MSPLVFLGLSWLLLAQPTLVPAAATNTTAGGGGGGFMKSKPDCPLKCGNVTVPYPFGIGLESGCSFGYGFDVNCNDSFNPPKPFIGNGNIEILHFSESQLRIKNFVGATCYNQSRNITQRFRARVWLGDYPLTFSHTANKFTVTGCDDVALFNSSLQDRKFFSGCASI